MAKIEIFKGADEKHYWHLKADNGEIVAGSEGYTSQENAIRGAGDLLKAAADCMAVRHALVPGEGKIFVEDDETPEEGS